MNQHKKKYISVSTLYLVPTPIGNLGDITQRALSILQYVDLVVAEDTRRTGLLLKYFAINTRLFSLHDHNESQKMSVVIEKLKKGFNIALVSDAGTPIINDPGYKLVRCCRDAGIRIVPLPGACALITALSAAGLPVNKFCYEGFLPKKRRARFHFLQSLKQEQRTMIFYESTYRLLNSLKDMIITLGPFRYVVLARELTKIWETIYGASVVELLTWVQENDNRRRGEIVIIVEGCNNYDTSSNVLSDHVLRTFSLLREELPLKKAAKLTAEIHNVKKNILYRYAIDRQEK